MSTLQVANIHLESTGNNRIQYDGSNTFTIAAGDANVAVVNSSTISINTNTSVGGTLSVNTNATVGGTLSVNTNATVGGANVVTVSDVLTQATWETGTDTTEALVSPAKVAAAISALGGSALDYQVFTSSGTWTKPSDVTFVMIHAWGGGGGGSPSLGGGGAAFSEKIMLASDLPSTVTVTIGAGGVYSSGYGTNGGTSTFGSYVTAYGGGGSGQSGGYGGGTHSSGTFNAPGLLGGGTPSTNTLISSASNIFAGGAGGPNGQAGGKAVWGGGGGAGAQAAGGASILGGNGGNSYQNGVPPGGGAGAGAGGMNGARGEVRVWAW